MMYIATGPVLVVVEVVCLSSGYLVSQPLPALTPSPPRVPSCKHADWWHARLRCSTLQPSSLLWKPLRPVLSSAKWPVPCMSDSDYARVQSGIVMRAWIRSKGKQWSKDNTPKPPHPLQLQLSDPLAEILAEHCKCLCHVVMFFSRDMLLYLGGSWRPPSVSVALINHVGSVLHWYQWGAQKKIEGEVRCATNPASRLKAEGRKASTRYACARFQHGKSNYTQRIEIAIDSRWVTSADYYWKATGKECTCPRLGVVFERQSACFVARLPRTNMCFPSSSRNIDPWFRLILETLPYLPQHPGYCCYLLVQNESSHIQYAFRDSDGWITIKLLQLLRLVQASSVHLCICAGDHTWVMHSLFRLTRPSFRYHPSRANGGEMLKRQLCLLTNLASRCRKLFSSCVVLTTSLTIPLLL